MHHSRRRIILLDNDDQVARQVSHVFGGTFLVVQVQNPRSVIGLLETDPSIVAIITEQVLRCGAESICWRQSAASAPRSAG